MKIIADLDNDRNFRYEGKEGLPGKTVRQFPAERTDPQGQFLQAFESCTGTGLSLPGYQGVLWVNEGQTPEYGGAGLRHPYPVHGPEKDKHHRTATGQQGDAPFRYRLQH